MKRSYASEAVSFGQELVRIPGESGQERGVAEAVEREMRMLGYDQVERDAFGSVVGVVRGAHPGRTVLFDAHMDVVPVTDAEAWTHPPFSGAYVPASTGEEAAIWGRGSVDIKGSLAAALVALGSLDRAALAGSLILSASVGEEMIEGVALAHVLARHRADRVVICEPTSLRVGLGHKGRTGIVIEARGRAAHSSRPDEGINAVYRMMDAVAAIRALPARRDPRLGRGVCELVEIISHPYPGGSMVPPRCTARFDRRLVRGETPESVMAEMGAALDGVAGCEARYHRARLDGYTGHSVTVDDFRAAWAVDAESEMVTRARQALRAAAPRHPGLTDATFLAPYCTNGAISAGEMGIPTIIYGAGRIEVAHAIDEHVAVHELESAYHGYCALARALTT